MLNNGSYSRWRVSGIREFHKKSWQGEVVVFDDASGDTLRLDILTTEILFMLYASKDSLDEAAVTAGIADLLGEEPSEILVKRVQQSLSNLKNLGLIMQE